MHCGSPLTPLALPAIIASLAGQGLHVRHDPPDVRPARRQPRLGSAAQSRYRPSRPSSWRQAIRRRAGMPARRSMPLAISTWPTSRRSGSPTAMTISGAWQSTDDRAEHRVDIRLAAGSIALDPSGGVDLVYSRIDDRGHRTPLPAATRRWRAWTSPVPVAKLPAPASTATIAIDPRASRSSPSP